MTHGKRTPAHPISLQRVSADRQAALAAGLVAWGLHEIRQVLPHIQQRLLM